MLLHFTGGLLFCIITITYRFLLKAKQVNCENISLLKIEPKNHRFVLIIYYKCQ